MDKTQAQQKIKAAIMSDAEGVIEKAKLFDPSVCNIVDDVRKAPGTIQGVAAIALKHALRGKSNEDTEAKIIMFAKLI